MPNAYISPLWPVDDTRENDMKKNGLMAAAFAAALLGSPAAMAALFSFTTGSPDGLLGTASRPDVGGKTEIESADDFTTTAPATSLTSATFTGLITGAGTLPAISDVVVEIYRIFPKDSNTARTPNVPSRANSPSDVEFVGRDTAAGNLTFTTSILSTTFSAANSVLNGINKSPNQTTNGEGPIRGLEVLFNVTFTDPIVLPADHYFFIPQVALPAGDEFYWLSAPKTIPAPADLQSWIRNANLDPDWLRIGTDIISGSPAPNFNASFSLTGTVPEPASLLLLLPALLLFARLRRQGH
jgi:hypothetical protein